MTMKKMPGKPESRARLRWGALIALMLVAAALWIADRELGAPADLRAQPPSVRPAASTPAPDGARSARETAYDKDVKTLEGLIADERADAQTRAQAGERLARMVSEHQSELGVEEALERAGFKPCFALMQNGSLTVMVGGSELDAAASAAILSLCVAHAEVSVENVRIMTGLEP